MKRISRSAIVECSAETFYALVEEIEAYPSFLPWCAAAVVRERSAGRTVATLTLGVKGIRQSFTTENTNVPGRSIDMRLLEGPFKRFAASWRFTALQAQACKAEFSLEYQFANRLVAATLGPVFSHIADSTVEAFTKRANRHPHGQATAR
ncbi:MAG TPA: type II toxin-antitoxin system RatA family toxin [Burkholderiales bacterium]|nr:type II toxin-antitoxin system RatA family toxin [Burkholderiales bacterium]